MQKIRELILAFSISYCFSRLIFPLSFSGVEIDSGRFLTLQNLLWIYAGICLTFISIYLVISRFMIGDTENLLMLFLVLFLFKNCFKLAQYNFLSALLITGLSCSLTLIYLMIYVYTYKEIKYLDEWKRDKIGISSFNNLCLVLVFSLSLAFPFIYHYDQEAKNNLTELVDNPVSIDGTRLVIATEYTSVLNNFVSSNYTSLNLKERLENLQFIEYIEAKVAGRPANKVISTHLDKDILGKYHHLLNIIIINDYLLASDEPERTLRVLLHESQHANQYELMKSLNFQNRTTYTLIALQDYVAITNSLNSYIDYSEGLDNYDEYYNQLVEVDANFNALVALSQYSQVVNGISPYLDELNRNHE